jgi:hypothetical protein
MDEQFTQPPETPQKLTFPDLIKFIVVDFVGFARLYLAEPRPPLMFIAVWLIGMDAVAAGIDMGYFYYGQYQVDNWFYAWLQIIFWGAGMGFVRYWLVGSIFHIVVVASGGRGHAHTSRYILLYALLPASVCSLSIRILQMLFYQNVYFTGQRSTALEGLFGMVMIAAYVFTLVLCYRGMRALQHTDKRRSILVLTALTLGTILFTIIGLGLQS